MDKKTTNDDVVLSDDFIESETEVVDKDSVEGQPDTPEREPASQPQVVKDSDEGQPDKEEEKVYSASEVASAISKANETSQQNLEMVLGLLKDNPEKLAELEKANPKLVQKLRNRSPELFEQPKEDEATKSYNLEALVTKLIDSQEKQDFEEWRKANKVSSADYTAAQKEHMEIAKTLYDNKLLPTWKQAIEHAGKIVFPHLNGKSVDNEKLKRINGQVNSVGTSVPSDSDDFDATDEYLMKKTGMSKEQFKKAQSGEIIAPGIENY